jgi:transposase-like protein
MTTRDIQDQLQDLYGVEVSHALISKVTEAVEAERKAWQNRSLDAVYPIVFLDALMVKVRHEGRVINKQYPTISKSWLNHWQQVIPFFAFPADIRKAIYTTNAIRPPAKIKNLSLGQESEVRSRSSGEVRRIQTTIKSRETPI